MRKYRSVLQLLTCFALLSTACYYDVEEDLVDPSGCQTTNLSFRTHILPIIESRCYKCHAAELNLGNVTLEGYDALKIFVDNNRLLGAVKHDQGFSPMPQNEAMLSPCQIGMIESWIQEGAENN